MNLLESEQKQRKKKLKQKKRVICRNTHIFGLNTFGQLKRDLKCESSGGNTLSDWATEKKSEKIQKRLIGLSKLTTNVIEQIEKKKEYILSIVNFVPQSVVRTGSKAEMNRDLKIMNLSI